MQNFLVDDLNWKNDTDQLEHVLRWIDISYQQHWHPGQFTVHFCR
jgi:hypothetical protein